MAPVTSLYAAVLTVLFVFLTVRVISQRRSSGISLGSGNDPALERATRVHGNFAEYVPLALILLLLNELTGYPRWMLHAAGVVLVVGRISHAYGMSQARENFRLRVVGLASTLTTMLILSGLLVLRAIH